jgi:hypothetical protein
VVLLAALCSYYSRTLVLTQTSETRSGNKIPLPHLTCPDFFNRRKEGAGRERDWGRDWENHWLPLASGWALCWAQVGLMLSHLLLLYASRARRQCVEQPCASSAKQELEPLRMVRSIKTRPAPHSARPPLSLPVSDLCAIPLTLLVLLLQPRKQRRMLPALQAVSDRHVQLAAVASLCVTSNFRILSHSIFAVSGTVQAEHQDLCQPIHPID